MKKARGIKHKLLEKNTGYGKSKINNPQVIFLLGSKQITTKATWNMEKKKKKPKTVTWNDRKMKTPIWLINYKRPIERKYWVKGIHFKSKTFDFKHFQIILNMQHQMKAPF